MFRSPVRGRRTGTECPVLRRRILNMRSRKGRARSQRPRVSPASFQALLAPARGFPLNALPRLKEARHESSRRHDQSLVPVSVPGVEPGRSLLLRHGQNLERVLLPNRIGCNRYLERLPLLQSTQLERLRHFLLCPPRTDRAFAQITSRVPQARSQLKHDQQPLVLPDENQRNVDQAVAAEPRPPPAEAPGWRRLVARILSARGTGRSPGRSRFQVQKPARS